MNGSRQASEEPATSAPYSASVPDEAARAMVLRRVDRNENICSTQGRASQHPRDEAIRAAHHDAAVLPAILADEFLASCRGPERSEYLRVLGAIVADLGGALDTGASGVVVAFDDRRIAIRFGNK